MRSHGLTGRIRSLRCALVGLAVLVRSQTNARIHVVAALAVTALGLLVGLGASDWIAITIAITSVVAAEALNTAVELLCDIVSPDFHPLVKQAKDVAAGAVLICALGAVVIGLIVFVPHVRQLSG